MYLEGARKGFEKVRDRGVQRLELKRAYETHHFSRVSKKSM